MTVAIRGGRRRRLPTGRVWVVALVAPLLALGGLAAFVVSRSRGDGVPDRSGSQSASAWQAEADVAFRPVTGGLLQLLRDGAEWRAGRRADADMAGLVDRLIPRFAGGAGKLAELPVLQSAPRAKALLEGSVQLYTDCLRVTAVALREQGDLRAQLDLLGQRLRILGDRVYDRARVAVDPKALESLPAGGVDLRLPSDVPNWADAGLAAGPPLAAATAVGAEFPAERERSRPEQPEEGWRRAVEAAGIPPVSDLVRAITTGETDALDGLAARLEQTAAALAAVPDPPNGRERAATVRLSLLVHAEAARAARAAALVTADPGRDRPALLAVARRLVLIGDGLWDPALPERVSGLDPGLLRPSPTG
jgi:hypothetical protein